MPYYNRHGGQFYQVEALKNLCPTVCDIYDRIPRSIRDLLADLNRDPWARINLHLFDAFVCCVKASLCFDHYLVALAAGWNEEGDLKIVGLIDHVWIIPYGGDTRPSCGLPRQGRQWPLPRCPGRSVRKPHVEGS